MTNILDFNNRFAGTGNKAAAAKGIATEQLKKRGSCAAEHLDTSRLLDSRSTIKEASWKSLIDSLRTSLVRELKI